MVSMEEPVGLSLDHVAGRLYWISEYKEVRVWDRRALPPRCWETMRWEWGGWPWLPCGYGQGMGGNGAQIWCMFLGWKGKGITVSPMAAGWCWGIGVP